MVDSNTISGAILSAERIGLLLFVVISIVGAAIVSFGALSAGDGITAFMAGVSVVSGVVVLGVIVYLETHVWDSG